MTVRLRVPYGTYKPNDSLTTGAAVEADLLLTGRADTGVGVTSTEPDIPVSSVPVSLVSSASVDSLMADGRTFGLLTVSQAASTQALLAGAVIADSVSRSITAQDNGLSLTPTVALTYTIPAGLSPKPSFTVDCPATGTITMAVSGGATINGATLSVTRTRANNNVGFVVLAHPESNSYGVNGA